MLRILLVSLNLAYHRSHLQPLTREWVKMAPKVQWNLRYLITYSSTSILWMFLGFWNLFKSQRFILHVIQQKGSVCWLSNIATCTYSSLIKPGTTTWSTASTSDFPPSFLHYFRYNWQLQYISWVTYLKVSETRWSWNACKTDTKSLPLNKQDSREKWTWSYSAFFSR